VLNQLSLISKEDSLAFMTHNYKHGFSGFAAMLTEDQAEQLAGNVFINKNNNRISTHLPKPAFSLMALSTNKRFM